MTSTQASTTATPHPARPHSREAHEPPESARHPLPEQTITHKTQIRAGRGEHAASLFVNYLRERAHSIASATPGSSSRSLGEEPDPPETINAFRTMPARFARFTALLRNSVENAD